MDYPKLRNIDAIPVEMGRQRMVGLRDPSNLTDEVLVVPHSTLFLLRFFDGRHSLLDIQAEYMRHYGEMLFTDSLEKLIEELDSRLFLESDRFREYQERIVQEFKGSRVRKACHAEKGYPSDPEKLREMLEGFFIAPDGPGLPAEGSGPQRVAGVIAPHIDLRSGGSCLAYSHKEIAESCDAELFIILGTAHVATKGFFTFTPKDFETPLGLVETDREFLKAVQEQDDVEIFQDEFIHRSEHSVEFQVLFLQYILGSRREFRIVPVLCGSFHEMVEGGVTPMEVPAYRKSFAALKEAIDSRREKVCLIASADLAHIGLRYGDESPPDHGTVAEVEEKDREMLQLAEKINPEGFYRYLQAEGDKRRVCGFPSIYALLGLIKAKEGKLLHYSRWQDQSLESFVTFASMVFYE
jgi:hypothetical protein